VIAVGERDNEGRDREDLSVSFATSAMSEESGVAVVRPTMKLRQPEDGCGFCGSPPDVSVETIGFGALIDQPFLFFSQPKKVRGSFIKTGTNPGKNTWLVVTPKAEDGPGALANILDVFKFNRVNLVHIESRSSHREDGGYEFLMECDDTAEGSNLPNALEDLKKKHVDNINVISRDYKDNEGAFSRGVV